MRQGIVSDQKKHLNYFLKFDKNNFHQYNNTIIYKYKECILFHK